MKPIRIGKLAFDPVHILSILLAVGIVGVAVWQHAAGNFSMSNLIAVAIPALGMLGTLMKKSPGDLAKELIDDITGAGGGGTPAAGSGKTTAASTSKPPASLRVMTTRGITAGLLALFCACSTLQAAFPTLDKAESIVLADLAAGKDAPEIEADVAKAFAGQPGVDVVVIVNDAITLLVDAGVIPPGVIPQAHKVLAAEKAKLAARPPAGG